MGLTLVGLNNRSLPSQSWAWGCLGAPEVQAHSVLRFFLISSVWEEQARDSSGGPVEGGGLGDF